MDYTSGTGFSKLEWDAIYAPGLVVKLLERDEDAMVADDNQYLYLNNNNDLRDKILAKAENGNLNFVAPNGKIISLPANVTAVNFTGNTINRNALETTGETTEEYVYNSEFGESILTVSLHEVIAVPYYSNGMLHGFILDGKKYEAVYKKESNDIIKFAGYDEIGTNNSYSGNLIDCSPQKTVICGISDNNCIVHIVSGKMLCNGNWNVKSAITNKSEIDLNEKTEIGTFQCHYNCEYDSQPCSDKFIKKLSTIIGGIKDDIKSGIEIGEVQTNLNIATECTLKKLELRHRKRLYGLLFANSETAHPYSSVSHIWLAEEFDHIGIDGNKDYLLLALIRTADKEEQNWLVNTFLKDDNYNVHISESNKIKTNLEALVRGIPERHIVSCAIPALKEIYRITNETAKPTDETFTVTIDGNTITRRYAENPIMFYYENWLQKTNSYTIEDGNIKVTCDELEMTLNSDNSLQIKQKGYFTINGEKLEYNEDYNIHPWQPVVMYVGKNMADAIPGLEIGNKIVVPAIEAWAYYEIGQRRVYQQNVEIGTAVVIGLFSGVPFVTAAIEGTAVTASMAVSGITVISSEIMGVLLAIEDDYNLEEKNKEDIQLFKKFYYYWTIVDAGVNLYSSLTAIETKMPNILNGLLSKSGKNLIGLEAPTGLFRQLKSLDGSVYRAANFWNETGSDIVHYLSADAHYYIKYDNATGRMLFVDAQSKKFIGFALDEGGLLKNATDVKFGEFLGNLKTTHGLSGGKNTITINGQNITFATDKANVVLGKYEPNKVAGISGEIGTDDVIAQLSIPKNYSFADKSFELRNGSVQVLNIPERMANTSEFFDIYNKELLDLIVENPTKIRVILVSDPRKANLLIKFENGIPTYDPTGFAMEIRYLRDRGIKNVYLKDGSTINLDNIELNNIDWSGWKY
jgi:hypothetical protein